MDPAKPYMIRCTHCRAKNRIPKEAVNNNPVCGKCKTPLNMSVVSLSKPVDVSDKTFENEVLQSAIPVLAVFWAPWCSACQVVLPIVNRIASGLSGRIKTVKINTEKNPATASRFQVMSVPLMIIFDNGKVKEDIMGAASEMDILKKLAHYY
jgi:thioredoxin